MENGENGYEVAIKTSTKLFTKRKTITSKGVIFSGGVLGTIKLLLNSVVSKPAGQFMTADVKNFYLNTPLERLKYMRIPIKLFPQEIIDAYGLTNLLHNDHVYVEQNKEKNGQPKSSLLENKMPPNPPPKNGVTPPTALRSTSRSGRGECQRTDSSVMTMRMHASSESGPGARK